MKESDLEEILAIEKRSFATPGPAGSSRKRSSFPHSVNFVLQGRPVLCLGYINFYLIGEEAHHAQSCHTSGMAKEGPCHADLLNHAIDFLKHRNAAHFFLEVREGNRDAIELYRKFGFRDHRKRKRYYVETNEDALVMHLACGGEQHA